jgi:hypothetical protein
VPVSVWLEDSVLFCNSLKISLLRTSQASELAEDEDEAIGEEAERVEEDEKEESEVECINEDEEETVERGS